MTGIARVTPKRILCISRIMSGHFGKINIGIFGITALKSLTMKYFRS